MIELLEIIFCLGSASWCDSPRVFMRMRNATVTENPTKQSLLLIAAYLSLCVSIEV